MADAWHYADHLSARPEHQKWSTAVLYTCSTNSGRSAAANKLIVLRPPLLQVLQMLYRAPCLAQLHHSQPCTIPHCSWMFQYQCYNVLPPIPRSCKPWCARPLFTSPLSRGQNCVINT